MRRCFHPAPSIRAIAVPSLLLVIAVSMHAQASADNRRTDFFIPPLIVRNTAPVWAQPSDSLRIEGGDTVNVHLVAVDPDAQPIQLSTFAMPDFVAIVDSGNGHGCLVVTPPTMLNGRFSMLVMAIDDSAAADTIDFTVIVSRLNRAPIWVSPDFDSIAVTEGDDFSLQLTATDPDGDYLHALVLGGLTPKIVTDGSGVFDLLFSPDHGSAGEYPISVVASDLALADTLRLHVTVIPAPPNHPPKWSTPDADSIGLHEGEMGVIQGHVTDDDGDPLSISIHSELPTALSDNGDGFLDVYVMPDVGETGRKSVVLVASDGRDSASIEIIVQVFRNPARNHRPEFVSVPTAIQLNVNRDTTVAINAIDSDMDDLSFSGFYIPNFVEFVGRPFPALGDAWADLHISPGSGHQGIFPVYLVVSDGQMSDTSTVWITITNINFWPEIGEIPARTIDEGDTLEIEIVASDPNGTTVTLSAFSVPTGATFVDHRNNQGTFRFIPSFSQAGQYRVGFVANDGSLRDTVFLDITVLNKLRPPQLANVSAKTVNEGAVIRIPISATDPDNDPIVLSGWDLPEHAVLTDSGNGRGDITFAPVIGQIGPFELGVIASDGALADSISILVTVLQVSVPPDSVAEVDFVTEQVAKYVSQFAIDQIHTEDLDLDGIDEVLFRENVDGWHVLKIWSTSHDSFWTLPSIGTGIKSYSLRSGPGVIEPVVWTNSNQLLALAPDRDGWYVIAEVPATATRVQMLPPNPEGWLAVYSIPIYEQSTFWGEPDGSCLGTRTEHSTRSFGYSDTDTSSVWGIGWAQQLPFDHGSIFQLFNHGLLEELLIHAYHESRSIESCGNPSDYFYATLSLHSFPMGGTGAVPIWEHYTVSFDLVWSYGQGRPSPYTYGIGLSRWNDRMDTTLKVCFAGYAGEASAYNTTNPYALNTLTRGDGWEIAEARFALPATPTRGGVVTISGDEPETMLLAPDAGFGYIINIPQAEFQGRLAMPAPGRFKTGYVMDASHRDMVFKVSNGVAVYRTKAYVPPRDSALVHHVPADFPTIQGAINAALSGDTILVAPGSYPGSIDFLGKDICLKSSAGASSTFILPASTTRPAVRFAGGESDEAILDGFTIRLSSTSMVAIENEARPIIRNNIFGEQQGSGDVVTIKSKGALITRNVFVGNTNARCIDVLGAGSARIIGNTLDRNGRGVNSSSESTIFFNNILSNHSGSALSGSFDSLDYNVLWNNKPNYNVTSYLQTPRGSHDILADPHFVRPGALDYRLTEHSLCIDNGHPGEEYTDADGSFADVGAVPYLRTQFPVAANLDVRVDDRWHLIDENPVFDWRFIGGPGEIQQAVQFELGTDQEWSVAEVWASGERVTANQSLPYTGPKLDDAEDYYFRIRLRGSNNWGPWSEEGMHTNGLPSIPSLQFPFNGTVANPAGLTFACSISSDPEADSVYCVFEAASNSDFLNVEFTSEVPVTDSGWAHSETPSELSVGRKYWWRARGTDHREHTSWSSARAFTATIGTIKVPLDQPTIQLAIRAAATGDTVLVPTGAYDVNLDFLGKGVYLKSELGANLTLLRPLDSTKSMISINNAISTPSAVDGFTISGCKTAAISVYKSRPTIINNVIEKNRSAISASYTMGLVIQANTIRDNGMNYAPNWGNAAISLSTCDSTLITRNIAYRNTGYGIISSGEGRGSVSNNTLLPQVGHAIRARNGKFLFYNNIVVGSPEYAVDQSWYSTITADYNCTYDNQTDYLHAVPGPGSVFANPMFVNPAAGDFRLAAGSPCIDAGHPDPQYNDPDGSRNDIGAYPFVPGVSALHPDDHNGDGIVDVRDAVRLIDLTVRKAEGGQATGTSDQIRVRELIRRIWGRKETRK